MITERIDTVVIGAGQAGLAVGFHLAGQGRPFVLLDAHERVGDSWRQRWDSLRLFTPARYDALPGSRFPGSPWAFPSREEFSDYLERYAVEHALPVRTGTRVRRVAREGSCYLVEIDGGRLLADHVVVAAGFDRLPQTPAFSTELEPSITQVHSAEYRNPAQVPDGDVLVVGAGNSGADIALELSRTHQVHLSGRHPGQVPFRIERPSSRMLSLLVFAAFAHVLTTRTPMGRRARAQILAHSGPLISWPPVSTGSHGSSGSATDSPSRRTAARSRSRAWSGAPGIGRTTPGSTCRSSGRTAFPSTSAECARRSRACTSSARCSSTPWPPR